MIEFEWGIAEKIKGTYGPQTQRYVVGSFAINRAPSKMSEGMM